MENPTSLLKYNWRKELPVILQTEMAECGIVCIAMIANYQGYKTDLNSLRRKYSISTKGATLQDLIKLANSLDFNTRPLRLELEELVQLKLPCILHWDLNHFVVLKKVKHNYIIIHDPAFGIKKISIQETSKHFTGIALEITPTIDFKPKKDIRKAKLSDFWSNIKGVKRVLFQILLLSFLLQIFSIVSPFYMQLVVDDVIISRDLNLLLILALGFGFVKIVSILVESLRSIVILYMGTQLSIQMASNLLRHLLKLPLEYFEKRHIGDIVSRFGSIEEIKQLLTTGIIETIVDGIMAIGLLVVMLIYSFKLTVLVLIALVLYFLIRFLLYKPYKELQEESLVTDAKQSSNFMETIRGIQSVKLFGKESDRITLWHNYYADSMNNGIKLGKLTILYSLINSFLFGIENILIIYLAANSVINNVMSVGMLYAFMSYKGQFISKSSALIDKIIQFKMLSLHLQRLGDIVLTDKEKDMEGLVDSFNFNGNIFLKDLCFRYSDNEPFIIKDLNLKIKSGSSVAIVGSSGSGKTTLMKLILGLLKPEEGTILIDEIEITKIGLNNYRKSIGTVMQNDELLSGSLAENISFFNQDFDQNLIEESAKMAAIHEDILKMPMGYNTLIGDMGSSLSGGQKQRILLARALYKKPKILFLDEATSHLDVGLESIVNDTVKNLNITRIIIAHRPETIAMADRVILLQNGKIQDLKN
ncbi:peptidase domain-containing ABC transporter [Aquimarina algicola]|uniref:Peptidase domain-containing ABC transporter n=1 Tax=Aquimarina algicola TaxID=2589995 RepID=A0A504J466_9FLAO|nr:peptidase domain-containing ABC transporter [Aquimarina algicola]TPN82758.1 peptidase domain-containing ABC transporter [Aquimarina algicola]